MPAPGARCVAATVSARVAGSRGSVAVGDEQLLDEERVAARAAVKLVRDGGRDRLPGDRFDLSGDPVPIERLEVEPADEWAAGRAPRPAAAADGRRATRPYGT